MLLPRSARPAAFALAVCIVAGCATPPPVRLARTTVVLMPDEDGAVGAVTVTSGNDVRRIDEAYAAATVEGINGKPSDASALGREAVAGKYAAVLQAQPPKPKNFTLNFLLDKTALTEESKAMIPAVLAAVRERKPTEITIFGHADASGSEKRNLQLSAERAQVVANLLRKTDPTLDRIDVQYFGDKSPLIPSRSVEPRNRRAEIQIL